MKYIYLIAIVLIGLLTACSSSVAPVNSNTGASGSSSTSTSIQLTDGSFKVVVSPVYSDNEIKDLSSVSFSGVPEGAAQILLILKPKNMPSAENPFTAPNVIAKFLDPKTQSATLETLSVQNGDYELSVGISSSDGTSGWLSEVKTDLVVNN